MMTVRPEILRSEDQVAALMRGRRQALGMSLDTLNDAIGLTDGYAAKLEAPNRSYGRRVITETLFWWTQALGLRVVLMDAAQADALVAGSSAPPMTQDVPRASPGRDARQPVRKTIVRSRMVFTAPV